uniref:Transcription factor HY5-like n=1 Tax=Anthurium amnicola TaxID=1678845 RepID=A0A1D1XKJ3_9ARAE
MSSRELSSASTVASPCRTAPPLQLFPSDKKIPQEESDEELFTVPDWEAAPSSSKAAPNTVIRQSGIGASGGGDRAAGLVKVRKGRNPQDREYRKLKRLLRNRVSAQQARERKKVYVNDLESRVKELQEKNEQVEEKISTLVNENTMLRKVLMNMRPKIDETTEPQKDQSGKS